MAANHEVYVAGSLKSERPGNVAADLRANGFSVFDDWRAPGPDADDHWKTYEQARGRTYEEALKGHAAVNIYNFDKRHIDASDALVLVLPAGKSGHLELGYFLGQGKRGYILLDDTDVRWDIMYQFCTGVFSKIEDLMLELARHKPGKNKAEQGISTKHIDRVTKEEYAAAGLTFPQEDFTYGQ